MVLPHPTKDVVDSVRAEFGLDEQSTCDAVHKLREWLKSQPHLPHECDDGRLERWLIRCKNSLEKTKSSIDMYYTIKTAVPEILQDRDPESQWFKKIVKVSYGFPLPQLRDDQSRVVLLGCLDTNPANVILPDILKLCFMVQDVRMCEDYCSSDVYVMDFNNFSIGHITKVTFPMLKKMEVCTMKAFNMRIKEIHLINVPGYADVLIGLLKTVLKPKIAARIHIHSKDLSTLHKLIPKNILPSEYGGEGDSIIGYWTAWIRKLEKYRDWFLEQDKLKSDESKRPGKAVDSGDLFGIEGSFRKLNVD